MTIYAREGNVYWQGLNGLVLHACFSITNPNGHGAYSDLKANKSGNSKHIQTGRSYRASRNCWTNSALVSGNVSGTWYQNVKSCVDRPWAFDNCSGTDQRPI